MIEQKKQQRVQDNEQREREVVAKKAATQKLMKLNKLSDNWRKAFKQA